VNDSWGLRPQNVVDNLRELAALTGNAEGAQRVAWTETWAQARLWLRQKLQQLPVAIEIDEAGNTWATLLGSSSRALVMGSHIDSVANGGWLDGSLGVVGGLEVLRRIAASGTPPVTVRLVSWADEEGARFGPSCFGSSAVGGHFDPDEMRHLVDKDGLRLDEAVAPYGVDLDQAREAEKQRQNAAAYLELHIEQGPVLEGRNEPLGAVVGAMGVERHALRFTGQTAHAGSTPMAVRRDALIPAARLELELREIAKRHGGVCTMGSVVTHPGIATAVAGQCDCLLDQRHLDATALAEMYREAEAASRRFAAEEKVEVVWKTIHQIEPVFFAPELVDLCAAAIRETGGSGYRLPSGPLHDAVEMARAGVPTAMLFVQSLQGLSHTKEEDTREEHLRLGVEAFDRLADKTAAWIMKL
jgi:hydantoinase/carbamoylase family amidase